MIGIEAVIERQKLLLETYMPGKLDELDALYGDFELPNIQSWWIEEADTLNPQYPAVFLFEENPEVLVRTSGKLDMGYLTSIYVWDQADAEGLPRLSKRLWRYRRAILEILNAHRKEEGFWHSLLVVDFIASPAMRGSSETSAYRKCKAVMYQANVLEDF